MTTTTAAREVARVVAGVRDAQLLDPTPCAGMPVAGLLQHLLGLTVAFRVAAEKGEPVGGPQADADALPHDWRDRLPRQLDELVTAWADPAAREGQAEAGGVRMPADVMAMVALDELVLHGWDLAVATGQRPQVAGSDVAEVLPFVASFPPSGPERAGLFGPVVTVPDDAPVLDRLLGLAGRDPAWCRPS